MPRPPLPAAERRAREQVGGVLRHVRREQKMSLGEVCARLGKDEKGRLPYQRLLVRLAALYSRTPESIIEEATGQSSLNLLRTFLGLAPELGADRRRVVLDMTPGEEVIVTSYLDWIRYHELMRAPREGVGPAETG